MNYINLAPLTGNNIFPKLAVFVLVFLVSQIAAKLSLKIAVAIKLIDLPHSQPHKQHSTPTPIAGGLIIFITSMILLAVVWISGLYHFDVYSVLPFVIIFVVGLIDDFYGLSAPFKFLGQIVVSILLILGNFQVSIFDSQSLNLLMTFFWYIGIINAFNLIDSADGLLLGICLIIGSTIFLATLFSQQVELNFFAVGMLGLILGLYRNNRTPAKIFLGDSGSLLLGLIFAVAVLQFNPQGFDRTTSWITPILMMALPIFDTTLVVVSRMRYRRSVFSGGLDHTFHRLSRFCGTERTAILIIYGISLLSNAIAMVSLYLPQKFAYFLLGFSIAVGIFLLVFFEVRLPARSSSPKA